MMRHSIVIIGGGVAGSLLAVQLTRLPGGPWPFDVTLLEPRPQPGPGTAYTNNRPEWLLNVRSANLSALPDEPDHFVRWLQHQGTPADPNGYYPRQTYGRYLHELLHQTLTQPAANGVQVRWLQQRAVAARPATAGTLNVQLADNQQLRADQLVLALGNFAPAPPVLPATAYWQHPRFHPNPWLPNALRSIGPTDSVLIIGTGLTALDALVGLHADGHRGPLVAVSRHGHWPAEHRPPPAAPYHSYYATDLAPLRTVAETLRAVRRRVAQAAAEGHDWRPVLDALRPDLGRIWQNWPLPEQQRFLRHLAARWSGLRHRNPPRNAAVLRALLAEGRLQVHKGRITGIGPAEADRLAVQLTHRGTAAELRADHVLLCTGPNMNYQHLDDPLVISLRDAGLLVPDPLRLGISTDEHGALLNAAGEAAPNLFTLGPSLRPLWFESTAVPELRQQAARLAEVLAARVR